MRKRLTRLAVVVGMAIALASGGLALTVITAFAGNNGQQLETYCTNCTFLHVTGCNQTPGCDPNNWQSPGWTEKFWYLNRPHTYLSGWWWVGQLHTWWYGTDQYGNYYLLGTDSSCPNVCVPRSYYRDYWWVEEPW